MWMRPFRSEEEIDHVTQPVDMRGENKQDGYFVSEEEFSMS